MLVNGQFRFSNMSSDVSPSAGGVAILAYAIIWNEADAVFVCATQILRFSVLAYRHAGVWQRIRDLAGPCIVSPYNARRKITACEIE